MDLTRRGFLVGATVSALGYLAGCNVRKEDERAERSFLDAIGLGKPRRIRAYGQPIDPEVNREALERVYSLFDPQVQEYMKTVPIIKISSVSDVPGRAGTAHSKRFLRGKGDYPYIGVGLDWDSGKRDFYCKVPILAHEFLHMIQAEKNHDPAKFFEDFKKWYLSSEYGDPVFLDLSKPENQITGNNRLKTAVFGDLYEDTENSGLGPDDEDWRDMTYISRYRGSTPGVEEFAYLFERIFNYSKESQYDFRVRERLLELSDELVGWYKGIVHPDILALRGR